MKTKEEIISDCILKDMVQERTCWNCGDKYTGMRVICDAPRCWAAWSARMAEIRFKYPQPRSSGALFYSDWRENAPKSGKKKR